MFGSHMKNNIFKKKSYSTGPCLEILGPKKAKLLLNLILIINFYINLLIFFEFLSYKTIINILYNQL